MSLGVLKDFVTSAFTSAQRLPEQSGIRGWIDEMFSGPSEWSAQGKQRTENIKAREHATAERIASEAFNREEAEKLREWQEQLSNTSYQRAVEDLKAAGINPILAAGTSGATTPVGASAKSAAAPSGASATAKEGLSGLAKVVGLVLMAVNTGARLANLSTKAASKALTGEIVKAVPVAGSAKAVNRITHKVPLLLPYTSKPASPPPVIYL